MKPWRGNPPFVYLASMSGWSGELTSGPGLLGLVEELVPGLVFPIKRDVGWGAGSHQSPPPLGSGVVHSSWRGEGKKGVVAPLLRYGPFPVLAQNFLPKAATRCLARVEKVLGWPMGGAAKASEVAAPAGSSSGRLRSQP